jgi:hypothetical protein
MPHVVLLGDSIFDNGAYVGGGPDVARQLRERLPPDWQVTLLAVDGAVVADVWAQVGRIPGDASHLVLSAGGNDALSAAGILDGSAVSVASGVDVLAEAEDRFSARYAALVSRLADLHLPLVLCTIYEGALPDAQFRRRAAAALHAFNAPIVRTAFLHRLDLIDLRLVCSDPRDYANPIEPSVAGGRKISDAIARAVGEGSASDPRSSSVYW